MRFTLLILSVTLFLFSCQQKETYIKHENGFEYLFYSQDKSANKPHVGDILVLSMEYYFNGDSLLFSSKELSNPFRMKLKRTKPIGETIDDALSLMHIGDSASFKLNASIFYTQTKKQDVPLNVKQDDQITFYVKLLRVISHEQFDKELEKKKIPDTVEQEQTLLESYLKTSGITVEPINSGLYFVEDIEGKGEKAKIGSQVTLHYSGYYINGKSFSSTYEMGKPFTFILGKDELINGFQEGILMMQKKGRYTLVIPSHLAYGSEGNSTIPPNKTLIFEIDIIDIK